MAHYVIANDLPTHKGWLNTKSATIDPANSRFCPDTPTLNALPAGTVVYVVSPATLTGAASTLADAAWAKAKTGAIILSTQQF